MLFPLRSHNWHCLTFAIDRKKQDLGRLHWTPGGEADWGELGGAGVKVGVKVGRGEELDVGPGEGLDEGEGEGVKLGIGVGLGRGAGPGALH